MNLSQKIARLIESVKYGEDVAPYGPDFREDLIECLERVTEAVDLVSEAAEAIPDPERFDELGEHLVANPAAFKVFAKIINEIEEDKTRIQKWTNN
ncbi:MAG: hypothetical protein CMI01_00225 [Oceanospirillaceae bacterium]|nr:hypothetical protein [Oceanospirillaceae bacterium]|tara:strand:+ start:209 stop:496 length:288 start_codon:yes stop_codon:yes gene_type:complete